MPEGSSSEAPVIKPGPMIWNQRWRGFCRAPMAMTSAAGEEAKGRLGMARLKCVGLRGISAIVHTAGAKALGEEHDRRAGSAVGGQGQSIRRGQAEISGRA